MWMIGLEPVWFPNAPKGLAMIPNNDFCRYEIVTLTMALKQILP